MQNDDNNEDQGRQGPDIKVSYGAIDSPGAMSFRNIKSKKPRLPKKLLIILISFVAVILVASGTLFYLVITKPESNLNKPTVSTLSALLDSIKSSLKDPSTVTALVQESGDVSSVTKNIKDNIWIMADDGSSVLSFSSERKNADLNESDYNNVIGALKSKDLATVADSDQPFVYSAVNNLLQHFSSQSIVCNLRNSPENVDDKTLATYTLRLHCVEQSDFSKNTESISPFVDAYTKSKTTDKGSVFGNPNVQIAGTEGFENANLNISDFNNGDISKGLFYRKKDSNWSYFKTTADQNKINCSEYNTDDLINSFTGVPCWDSLTNVSSFVSKPAQVIAPNPGDESTGSGG